MGQVLRCFLSVREATGPFCFALRPFCAMHRSCVAHSYPLIISGIQLLGQHFNLRSPRASKAWKRRIIWRSAPTDSAYCGAREARERGATRAIAGWNGYCRCVTPVVSGVDQRFPSSSKRCHACSQGRCPLCAGSPSLSLCRHLLPRDQFRLCTDSSQYNHSKNNVNSEIIFYVKTTTLFFIRCVANNNLIYYPE
jgi:hypothetical protein